ncbi:polyprenyl synthetase family protein [Streptomyces asoensis]|uniref:polyprenyl synthetase family protein n=1 Tax=Streptomyces asoensis TaxID=249586 RepID=UPI0034119206
MTDTAALVERVQARLAGHERRFAALFEEYFRSLAARIDAPEFSRFTPDCLGLLRDLSLRGGKRLRMVLLHEAARLVTDGPVPGLDEAALSVELFQTHALIHDDIIDDSPLRRGGPSTYYAYRAKFPGQPRAALGLALLAGDLALALSLTVLLESDAPPEVRRAMAEVQTRASLDTTLGQISDMERDFTPLPGEEVLHEVADFKTARYSVLAPMRLGLLAAGGRPELDDDSLRRYARFAGISGQMRDDYLDLFGEAEVMGKPTGTDLADGRRNYLVRAVLTAADDSGRAVVEATLGDSAASAPETVAAVREIARRCGAEARLRADMRHFAELAAAEAAGWRSRWRPEAVAFFEHLPLWNVQRAL